MKLKIGLITTLNTNIGDDFIRTGLCKVLQQVCGKRQIEFIAVNKHEPYTVYNNWHPIQIARISKHLPKGKHAFARLAQTLLATSMFSRFEHADAVVQCGAPVIWPQCYQCEWAVPLWHKVIRQIHERTPVLNLAAGSCFPWENQPLAIEDSLDAEYLRAIHGYCRLTTARDSLTRSLFKELGCDVQQIACSALLAADGVSKMKERGDLVLINYMPGGGHYDFGQHVDGSSWAETVRALVKRLERRHNVAFLCHNETEFRAASDLAGEIPRLWPKTIPEYFSMVFKAKVGIFNRMHASVALAGMGIPSIAIGTDTRLLMVKNLKLPCFYVKEASADLLEQEVEILLNEKEQERERLLQLRHDTWQSYVRCLSDSLPRIVENS